jgi:hypothetical protein
VDSTPDFQRVGEALLAAGRQGGTPGELAQQTGLSIAKVTSLLRRFLSASTAYNMGQRFDEDVWFILGNVDVTKAPVAARGILESKVRQKARRVKKDRETEERKKIADDFFDCVKVVAMRQPTFTVDAVREEFDARGGSFGGYPAQGCSGSPMTKAVRQGICTPTESHEISERRSGGLARVYRSLICEAPIAVEPETPEQELARLRAENTQLRSDNERLTARLQAV